MVSDDQLGSWNPGTLLHRELGRRAMPRFEAGFYDDAVFSAFKVVEERLRQALGRVDGTAVELITEAYSPESGRLQDPNSLPDERQALYFLFRGAFGYFRNPHGHRFPEITQHVAAQQLVLVNQLLAIIEDGTTLPQVAVVATESTTAPESKRRSA